MRLFSRFVFAEFFIYCLLLSTTLPLRAGFPDSAGAFTIRVEAGRATHGFSLETGIGGSPGQYQNALGFAATLSGPSGAKIVGNYGSSPDGMIIRDSRTGEIFALPDDESGQITIPPGGWVTPGASGQTHTMHFIFGEEREGHNLAVRHANGTTYQATQSLASADTINPWLLDSGDMVLSSLHVATAMVDPSQPYRILDLTSQEQFTTGETFTAASGWEPVPSPTPIQTVYVMVDEKDVGTRFTVHSKVPWGEEMLQSVTAEKWSDAGYGSYPTINGGSYSYNSNMVVGLTFPVGEGMTFWVTRDVDNQDPQTAGSTQFYLDPAYITNATELFWQLYGVFSAPPTTTVTFYIESSMGNLVAVQPSGVFPLESNSSTVLSIPDYDHSGNEHFFYYREFTATVLAGQPYWIGTDVWNILSTNAYDPWLWNGWSPINGAAPPPSGTDNFEIVIPECRIGHYLYLYRGHPWNYGSQDRNIGVFTPFADTLVNPWTGEERAVQSARMLTSASYLGTDPQGWYMIDQNTGDVRELHAGVNDLRDWQPAPEVQGVQVSLTRWTHDLRMRCEDGSEFPITKDFSQGDLSAALGSSSIWFNAYYYFNGFTQVRSGLDWFVWDETTQEAAPENSSNLIDWIAIAPVSIDSVAQIPNGEIEVAVSPSVTQNSAVVIERSVDGGYWELVRVSDVISRTVGTQEVHSFVKPRLSGTHTFRARTTFGGRFSSVSAEAASTINLADTDNDGLPDEWEQEHFGDLAQTGAGDADGDGISNLDELTEELNPVDFYNDRERAIRIVSGDQQLVLAGQVSHLPLVVELRDDTGQSLVNAPVKFTVASGAATFVDGTSFVSERIVRTDAQGIASVSFRRESTGAPLATILAHAGVAPVNPSVTFTTGWADSGTVSVSPAGGRFATRQKVTFTSSNPSAKIAFTVDGSEPTLDGVRFSSGDYEYIEDTATLKVRAFAADAVQGPLLEESYQITGALAAGYAHQLVLRTTGDVWAWGDNWAGHLGNGTSNHSTVPVQVLTAVNQPLKDVVEISAGQYHSVALRADGTVLVWGHNYDGQLGTEDNVGREYATQIPNLSEVVHIAAGAFHTLALKQNGTVWAWGYDEEFGNLGDGPRFSSNTPIRVHFTDGITPEPIIAKLSTGFYHNFAVDENGDVWAWGGNWNGELGNGTWTANLLPSKVPALAGAESLSGGWGFSYMVRRELGEPKVYGWGFNWTGNLGLGSTSDNILVPTPVPALAETTVIKGGSAHGLFLKENGALSAAGRNQFHQVSTSASSNIPAPSTVSLTNVVAIAVGFNQSNAMTADGKIYQWGAYSIYTGRDTDNNDTYDNVIHDAPTAHIDFSATNNADTDEDGVPDWEEEIFGLDRKKRDTDGDGIEDGDELDFGFDPTDYYNGDEPYPVLYTQYSGVNEWIHGYPIFDFGGTQNLKRRFLHRNATLRVGNYHAARFGMEDLSMTLEGVETASATYSGGAWYPFNQGGFHNDQIELPRAAIRTGSLALYAAIFSPTRAVQHQWAIFGAGYRYDVDNYPPPTAEPEHFNNSSLYHWDITQDTENLETHAEMVARASNALPPYSATFERVNDSLQPFGPGPRYAYPQNVLAGKWDFDQFDLDAFSLTSIRYQFRWEKSPNIPTNKMVQWYTVFTPNTGVPSEPHLVRWEHTGTTNETSTFEIDPRTMSGGRLGSYTISAIDIIGVVSDQIAANRSNRLPTPYYRRAAGSGGPNNPMLMATRTGQTAHIAIEVKAGAHFSNGVFAGVRRVGRETILGSTPCSASPGKTLISFTAIEAHKTYEVVAGFDTDGDGVLQNSEVSTVFSKTPRRDSSGRRVTANLADLDKVIIVEQTQYVFSSIFLASGGNFPTTDYAGDLVEAFGEGKTKITDATTTYNIPVNSRNPSLTHQVGAKWNAVGVDSTHRFDFADGTEPSDDFEESNALKRIVDDVIKDNIDTLIAYGIGKVGWSVLRLPDFAKGNSFRESEGPGIGLGGVNELHLAFGTVTVTGTPHVSFRVINPTTIEVGSINVSGSFDDLYDFDFWGGGNLPKQGSMVQAGYATLSTTARPAGKIFYTRLNYATGWRTFGKIFK